MVSPDNEHAPEQLIEEAAPEGPVKRGGLGRALGKTFGSLLLLTALAGAGGYAVIAFQDKDPRLKTAAKTLEDAIAKAREQAQSFTDAHVPSISGKITTPARRVIPVEEKPREDSAGSEPTTATPPQLDAETVQKAQREAEEAVKRAEADAQEKAQADAAAKEAEEKARAEAEAAAKRAAEEKLARETAEAAEREKAVAQPTTAPPAASATSSEELSARELATGLEGRIDELGDEIKALRERLDAPKNETRAAPETVEKPAPTPDSGAAQIVVAYTLQRQLEAGKPFGDELAALTRLGADSTTLDALRPLAEGAPTAAKLQSEFAGLSKKIHAPASGHAEDLTEQLSKLVKVRPPGQAATTDSSVEGIIARIDAALTHNELVAAETALASLPESARSELRSFADKLHARVEADKAADALVHGAIMALGKASDKN